MDIIGSSFPAWDNTHPKRMIPISANELTYNSPTPATGGGNAVVILRPAALREK